MMNGLDSIYLDYKCRAISEDYEKEVWSRCMSFLQPGMMCLDVGSCWGLFSLAFGKRVSPEGKELI